MARHKSLQSGLGRQVLPQADLPGLPLPQHHKWWVFMFYCKATKNYYLHSHMSEHLNYVPCLSHTRPGRSV